MKTANSAAEIMKLKFKMVGLFSTKISLWTQQNIYYEENWLDVGLLSLSIGLGPEPHYL